MSIPDAVAIVAPQFARNTCTFFNWLAHPRSARSRMESIKKDTYNSNLKPLILIMT